MPSTELVDVYKRDKGWIYFGGGIHVTIHDKDVRNHYNYFIDRWPDYFRFKPCVPVEERCVCLTKISQQCYIINIKTKDIVVLGNCCIRRFGLNGKTCSMCNAVHKNRSDNFCKDCRVINKNKQLLIEYRIKGLCSCGKKRKVWNGNVMPNCYSCWKKKNKK
jgi:hypothetical protein